MEVVISLSLKKRATKPPTHLDPVQFLGSRQPLLPTCKLAPLRSTPKNLLVAALPSRALRSPERRLAGSGKRKNRLTIRETLSRRFLQVEKPQDSWPKQPGWFGFFQLPTWLLVAGNRVDVVWGLWRRLHCQSIPISMRAR